MVIADLHIGFEDKIIRRGININPKHSVDEILEIIGKTAIQTNIKNLIILGDLKSSVKIINKTEWIYIPYFIKSVTKICNVFLIPGNHDGNITNLISEEINFMSINGMEIEDILLIHGHTSPRLSNNIKRIIIGHLHPTLSKEGSLLNGQKVWVYLKISKSAKQTENLEIIIMPKFNNIISIQDQGYFDNISSRKKRPKLPILHNLLFKKNWHIDSALCYSLDGDIIGNEDDIKKILG